MGDLVILSEYKANKIGKDIVDNYLLPAFEKHGFNLEDKDVQEHIAYITLFIKATVDNKLNIDNELSQDIVGNNCEVI